MSVSVLLGLLAGTGLCLAGWGMRLGRRPLQARLESLNELSAHPKGALLHRGRHAAVHTVVQRGLRSERTARDLRICGMTPEQLAVRKLRMLLFGAGLPIVVALLAWLGQTSFPVTGMVVVSLIGGALMFFVPDLALRERAQRRQREFRHHLGVFLDLVGVGTASGHGTESALEHAAAVGTAWGFAELRQALQQAQVAGVPPWGALEQLGRELGAVELEEIAATVSLASLSGSSVQQSLRTKAQSLRDRAQAEEETRAQQASERMSLPVVLMFCGFLVMLGYPAVANVLQT